MLSSVGYWTPLFSDQTSLFPCSFCGRDAVCLLSSSDYFSARFNAASLQLVFAYRISLSVGGTS